MTSLYVGSDVYIGYFSKGYRKLPALNDNMKEGHGKHHKPLFIKASDKDIRYLQILQEANEIISFRIP